MYSLVVKSLFLKAIRITAIRVRDFLERFKPSLLAFYFSNREAVKHSLASESHLGEDLYEFYNFKFIWLAPQWLKKHRRYFSSKQRGFGEKPFHSAWQEVFLKFEPKKVLEIGVYRGQVISLWQLIAQRTAMDIEVYGISPLQETGDSVSKYVKIDYESDIENNFNQFNLVAPNLIKALSTDFTAREFIESKEWDLIYIDGSHDFDVVLQDFKLALANLKNHGVLCFDDSSLYLDFEIKGIFKGHPGPSRVVRDFAMKEMKHLMTVGHNNFFVKII
jgi:hypothetical protein